MEALELLNNYAKLPFSAENMYLTTSVRTALPMQANSSSSETDDKMTGGKKAFTWFQLVANYKSNYSAVSETGEIMSDNATIKTLKIKFSKQSTEGVSASRFKDFFDTHFVGKQFFTFNVLSESPTRDQDKQNVGKYIIDRNSTDVMVHPDFKLIDFIREYETKLKIVQK
jgi:hypothetical protein